MPHYYATNPFHAKMPGRRKLTRLIRDDSHGTSRKHEVAIRLRSMDRNRRRGGQLTIGKGYPPNDYTTGWAVHRSLISLRHGCRKKHKDDRMIACTPSVSTHQKSHNAIHQCSPIHIRQALQSSHLVSTKEIKQLGLLWNNVAQ